MRKLTPRERVLIYIACMLGVLCLGFWLIKSTSYLSYSKAREAAEQARLELSLANSDKKTEDRLKNELKQLESFYRAYKEQLEPLLSDAELEEKILLLLESNSMVPESSEIISAKPCREMEGSAFLYKGSVTVNTRGTIEQISELLNQVSSSVTMRTGAYDINLETDIHALELTIDIYMLDDRGVKRGFH